MYSTRYLTAICIFSLSLPCIAHQESDSFLYFNLTDRSGRFDIALTDIFRLIPEISPEDGDIRWQDIVGQESNLKTIVAKHLTVNTQRGPCHLKWNDIALTQHSDRYHAALPFQLKCPPSSDWSVEYHLLFDQDQRHRALVSWESDKSDGIAVLSPESPRIEFHNNSTTTVPLSTYVYQGMIHLWVGADHMLFIIAMLLTTLVTTNHLPAHRQTFFSTFQQVVVMASLFTLAHSLTLTMAALGIVAIRTSLIEIIIAISVSIAGLQIAWMHRKRYQHLLAFGFGLIHGFGFANVLFDLSGSSTHRLLALAGFNLGIEIAQILLITGLLPVLYCLRKQLHKPWVVTGSSGVITAIGAIWAWQRLAV